QLQQREVTGECALWYFDVAGFCLTPCVPYAWQPIGEVIAVPTLSHGRRVNVLGFLKRNNELVPYIVEGKIDTSVMTLPQSGRLDGGEQPQGLPDERVQRLWEVTVFIPAWGIELLLVADRTAHVLFFQAHRGDRIPSRPEGFAVAMALATPTLPRHGN